MGSVDNIIRRQYRSIFRTEFVELPVMPRSRLKQNERNHESQLL